MEDKFVFLTKYSLRKKIKNKSFYIVNLILLLLICVLTNIDFIIKSFGGDFNKDLNIKVFCSENYCNDITSELKNVNSFVTDNKLNVSKAKDLDYEKSRLKDNKNNILIIINSDYNNIFNANIISYSYIDQINYQYITSALNNSKSKIALSMYNIDEDKLNRVYEKIDIKREILNDKNNDEYSKTIISFLSLVLCLPSFILIVFLVQMIGSEINEEKSTKSMEIIIGNISPEKHFLSKIISSNLFVLIQGALLVIYSLIGLLIRKCLIPKSSDLVTNITSTLDIQNLISNSFINELNYKLPLIIIIFILSFLAYSLVAGLLASVTTNMENYQQLQTPLLIINVVGYYLILLSSAFKGSILIKILSCIPLFSISLAPSLLLSNDISVELMFLSIMIVLLFDFLIYKYGMKIYKAGILNYEENNLWKKIFKSIKQK